MEGVPEKEEVNESRRKFLKNAAAVAVAAGTGAGIFEGARFLEKEADKDRAEVEKETFQSKATVLKVEDKMYSSDPLMINEAITVSVDDELTKRDGSKKEETFEIELIAIDDEGKIKVGDVIDITYRLSGNNERQDVAIPGRD